MEGTYHKKRHLDKNPVAPYFKILIFKSIKSMLLILTCYAMLLLFSSFMPPYFVIVDLCVLYDKATINFFIHYAVSSRCDRDGIPESLRAVVEMMPPENIN